MANTHAENPFQDTDPSHRFNPPQSNFGFKRRTRPPPVHLNGVRDAESRVPLKLERPESKGGLRGIFSRNNRSNVTLDPAPEDTPPVSAFSERSMKAVAERSLPRSLSVKRTTTAQTRPVTPKPTTRLPRMNLRSKSVKQANVPPSKKPIIPSRTSKSSPRSTKTYPQPPTRTSPTWDPPPLFQAYPQAVKHATLSASTLSADAILRISNHKRNSSVREETTQARQNGGDPIAAVKKTERAKGRHRRQISGSISKADWTQKIFILVTSGYLLQYAATGSFDRLPEKMMKLGKESVAFASDVIPGKHWVLQISQAMDSDGVPAADSRSLLSRLTFRGADYRRSATSLLLVLNSAEDMDAWMAVVRKEIEALGGKKLVSETGKPKADGNVMQLKERPSHRYLVQKDPDQFSNPASPQALCFAPPWNVENPTGETMEDAASTLVDPEPPVIRPSTGHCSRTNSTTSRDEQQLDNLRHSTNRLSYMSSGQRTLISSPATSPNRESFSASEDIPPSIFTEESRPRPIASAINERRRSMQNMPVPLLEAHTPKGYRHSTYGGPSRPIRNPSSPVPPNFSIPTSSIQRYTTIKGPVIIIPGQPTNEMPINEIPTIITTTPTKICEALPQGPRKIPPVALKLTVAQSLPLVKDSQSPLHQMQVSTPTKSLEDVSQIKPRTPSEIASSPNEVADSSRGFSVLPLNSHETSHVGFHLPGRPSSTRTLVDTEDRLPEAPLRPAPPYPSEALSTPLPVSPPITEMKEEANVTSAHTEKELLSPLPAITNTRIKLRRPVSMQIRATERSQSQSPRSIPKCTLTPRNRPLLSPSKETTSASSLLSPSMQRLKSAGNAKSLANRKSMPVLINGPPAPPPSCALPPLPPGSSSSSLKSPASAKSVRASVPA
ncbi:hypothetical protein LHYA1_G001505 [Lachnellula hyalina]|uniref:PH domain-containing protein n=1 Tax=Lachnellula hyalina TaxID=1316788 RepID=A0A8H8R6H6_9HELO|nr:uncharacterized protein LHYA1_G001505 [Lachnellula hyalina]TVY29493.1 hypothetical protein LHYA1_G001505 [Lachnellula hyalina]